MKFPICKICLKNDILCNNCLNITRKENIKKDEINAYREINKLAKYMPYLKDVEFKRILLSDNFALIIVKKDDISKTIGKNGIIAKKIAKCIKKQIRIIPDDLNLNEFVREILFSSSILGINTVYSPEGEFHKVRLPASEKELIQITPQIFSEIAKIILKKNVELVFE